MKHKILLSGSTGFIGNRVLTFLLQEGYYVTDLIRSDNANIKSLRLKYKKNYKSIILKNEKSLLQLKKKKFYCFINLATFYKRQYTCNDLLELNQSNIIFPLKILLNLNRNNIKFINFGTMQEYYFKKRNPINAYAASKVFFEELSSIIGIKKQYNIKLYETFDQDDNRDKIIPTLINAYKKNKKIYINNTNLKLNFITINNICNVLDKILNNKIKPGSYLIKNNKFIKIVSLIKKLNSKLNKKIKFKILNKKNTFNTPGKFTGEIIFKNDIYKSLITKLK